MRETGAKITIFRIFIYLFCSRITKILLREIELNFHSSDSGLLSKKYNKFVVASYVLFLPMYSFKIGIITP